MNVTRELDSPTEVTLKISMDAEDEEPFLNRSYRRVVGRFSIPGFRRGKAPRSIVEQHLGRSALVQEALDFMIPESLDQVLREHEIRAFAEPQVQVVEMEPVSFTAIVPLEPAVDLGDFRSIRLQAPPVAIGQEDIDRVLQDLRYESAPWEPANRPVAFGDLVTLNVHAVIGGDSVINDEGVDFIPEQDNTLPLPGFSIYIEGMREGQEKEFALTVPEDYQHEAYAGLEARFQVTALSIKEKKLPELDDEFAKGVRDGFESLEALSDHVRQRLTEEGETAAQRELERSSLAEVRNRATIAASDLVYQREVDSLREEQERALQNQRIDLATFLAYTGQTEADFLARLRPQAEERLATALIIRKLAEEEGLAVEQADVDAEVARLISLAAAETAGEMRRALQADAAQDSIRSTLLHRRVMARLVEIVTDGGADAESAGAADAADAAAGESTETASDAAPDAAAAADAAVGESTETASVATPDAAAAAADEAVGESPETASDATPDAAAAASEAADAPASGADAPAGENADDPGDEASNADDGGNEQNDAGGPESADSAAPH